jgi:hypothetical protein
MLYPDQTTPTEGSRMRRLVAVCCAAAVVGCAKSDQGAVDTSAAATPAPAPAPKTIALADVAGKWNVKGTNEAGDSTVVTYVFTATGDTSGWSITFPNRRPVPVHVVAVAGDSIVIASGPYESVLRKGVQVTTTGPIRMQDGKLLGNITARYKTKRADSVRIIRTEGVRAP